MNRKHADLIRPLILTTDSAIDTLIAAIAREAVAHEPECASRYLGACHGTHTTALYVRGFARKAGHRTTAEAVRACHEAGERYQALWDALKAEHAAQYGADAGTLGLRFAIDRAKRDARAAVSA